MPGSETTIKAIEALRCIRRGMTDRELMEQFNLSASALQSLFSQLVAAGILHASEVQARTKLDPSSVIIGVDHDTPSPFPEKKKVVDAAEALQCLKADMDDATLMAKFDISPRGLQSLLNKLVSAGAISQAELDERTAPEPVSPMPENRTTASPVASLAQMGIDPRAILEDIRSDWDDIALMEKFALSGEALQVVFEELLADGLLTPSDLEDRTFVTYPSVVLNVRPSRIDETPVKKPVIDAADALHCIKDGMDDAALMKRYELSARGLQSLLTKLVSAGAISQEELEKRVAESHRTVVVDQQITGETVLPEPHELLDLSKVIEDVKAGAGREALMEKYGLPSRDLQELLKGWASQGVIDESALNGTQLPGATVLEIRHKTTGHVIYRGAERSLGGLVEKGVSELVSLAESDLAGINLSRRDLSGAKLQNADMRKAILVGTDLTGADLSGASLRSADLYGANLYKAKLAEADLSDSNMTGVRAVWAFLAKANLSEANLTSADLTGANLGGANLFESILTGTKLDGAYLVDAKMDYVRKGR
jgi:uncharacterized protein YjbI with pentapeptide repeats/predicted transcriptional regulator